MATGRRGLSGFVLVRAAAIVAAALALGACSSLPDLPSLPDWVDPTSWFGPDVPDQTQADDDQSPDLSQMPQKPTASSSEEQQQVASSLASAGGNVQYSAQALRGGTEAAAPPPGPAAPAAQVAKAEQESLTANTPAPASRTAPEATAPVPPVPAPSEVASADEQPPAAATPPATPVEEPAPTPAGSSEAVPGAQPPVMAGNSLGFAASNAPPLDASVAEFVPSSIMASYARTAPVASAGNSTATGDVTLRAPAGAAVGNAVGGSVVASLGSLPSLPAVSDIYVGVPITSVVFSGNSTSLGANGRAQVVAAVSTYKAQSGQGYIRVVGHFSSAKGNMSDIRHMEYDFERSQARAKAVARELIRQGVPADKVLVSATGASGSAGQGGAEIFLQG